LAHLFDSPPNHNFFQTGFRPKKVVNLEILVKRDTKKCTFLRFFRVRQSIIGVDIEEGGGAISPYFGPFWARFGPFWAILGHLGHFEAY
jgi:hypothetical protein